MRYTYKVRIEKIARVNAQIVLSREGKDDFSTTMPKELLPEGAQVGDTYTMIGEIVWTRSSYGSKAHFEPATEEKIAAEKAAEEERKAANFARKAAQVLDELRSYARSGFFADQKAVYIRKLVGSKYDGEIREAMETAEEIKKQKETERREARRTEEAKYTHLALPTDRGFSGRPVRGQKLIYRGHAYEVVSAYYNDSDGMSFGAMSDEWYDVKAICIDDRADGQAMIEADDAEREAAAKELAHKNALRNLAHRIRERGTRYDGDEIGMDESPGTDIVDTFNVYGGGEIIRETPDTVWLIVNNGADGDNWGWNNIRTGGAGAYAFFVPTDLVREELEAVR